MTAAADVTKYLVPCGGCGGRGRLVWEEIAPCDICNGTGKLVLLCGMPVTIRSREMCPGTIQGVSLCGNEVDVREDEVRKGRFFLPGKVIRVFTRRRDGSWRPKGTSGPLLAFGIRCSGR